MPPSAIVSVPVPKLPMLTPELLLQVEPAPVTVTVPSEPAPLPMLAAKAVLLMTVPPFAIVSVPVPKLPILSPGPPGLLFQTEPGPVTVTAPFEPAAKSDGAAAATVHRAAVLDGQRASTQAPTTMVPAFVHVEPAPDTVTVPSEPGKLPTNPPILATVPPFSMVSVPVPEPPITRFPVFVQLASRAGYNHRALRTRRIAKLPGGRLEQSQSPGAYRHRPAAAGD